MKSFKRIVIAALLLTFLAGLSTSCTGGRVCQAKKTSNHIR
ncbi:MAG: hypothetical protein AAGI38_04360 [Bacteroidota bacterium]